MAFNSEAALSSAAMKFSLGSSPKLPSQVTSIPTVECSLITLRVPCSAASSNGMGSLDHGTLTMRVCPSSVAPSASGTRYPTQSIIRSLILVPSPKVSVTASSGTNLGSAVITVFPAALCGSSSVARFLSYSPSIPGMTDVSIKRLIKVDLPHLTGPTTPMYISPPVLAAISVYISLDSILSLRMVFVGICI